MDTFKEAWCFALPFAVGYGIAILGGQLAIHNIMKKVREEIGLPDEKKGHSQILGATEGILYTSALLAGQPQFIALWLGLKTVTRWRHWESDIPVPGKDKGSNPTWIFGRNAYNVFLLGNALVLLFSATGWKLVRYAQDGAWAKVWTLVIAITVCSVLLYAWAHVIEKNEPVEDSHPSLAKNQLSKTAR